MSEVKHISEIMHQLVLDNPNDPWAHILRRCPFIQREMIKKGYMSLDDLSDEEIQALIEFDCANPEEKEADHD